MYVDWEYYKIFYCVAKYRNFTKAARVLGSNQPNITHTMNKLEDQLHCVLFIRSNRGVTLTPGGRGPLRPHLLRRRADPGCRGGAERQCQPFPRRDQHQRHRNRVEHLPVGAAAGLSRPVPRHPAAHHEPLHPAGRAGGKNGEIDFAVVTTPAETGSDLKRVALMPFNEILVGGPSFAELAGRTLALQELIAYPLIMLENGSMSRIFYRQFFLEHNAELKPDIEAGTTDQMLTLVRSDLGLAFGAGADGPRQPASQAHFADEFAGGYPGPARFAWSTTPAAR